MMIKDLFLVKTHLDFLMSFTSGPKIVSHAVSACGTTSVNGYVLKDKLLDYNILMPVKSEIKNKKAQRLKYYQLTPKGFEIVRSILELRKIINGENK